MTNAGQAVEHRTFKVVLRRKVRPLLDAIEIFLHMIFWRFLWFTKLARPYSRFACKHNFYGPFPDGRCKWCGTIHGSKRNEISIFN